MRFSVLAAQIAGWLWRTVALLLAAIATVAEMSARAFLTQLLMLHLQFTVYTGESKDQLLENYNEKEEAAQSERLNGTAQFCTHVISPFGDTYVGIRHIITSYRCDLTSSREFDRIRAGLMVAGALMFLLSEQLTLSTTFRLSGGTLLITASSVLILMFILLRAVPHGKLGAILAVLGGTGATIVRYIYGYYFPPIKVRFT